MFSICLSFFCSSVCLFLFSFVRSVVRSTNPDHLSCHCFIIVRRSPRRWWFVLWCSWLLQLVIFPYESTEVYKQHTSPSSCLGLYVRGILFPQSGGTHVKEKCAVTQNITWQTGTCTSKFRVLCYYLCYFKGIVLDVPHCLAHMCYICHIDSAW